MLRLLTDDYFAFLRERLLAPVATLDILAYVINFQFYKKFYRSTQLFNLILSSKNKGARVRLILDSSPQVSPNHRTNLFTATKLKEHGFDVKMQTIPHPLHSKAFCFDSSLLVVGSHNLTQSALTNPLEMSVATDDPLIVKNFLSIYDRLYGSPITAPWSRKLWRKSSTK